jgi:5'-AMP-activated protein kinase catalytic alpha subunit
MQIIMYYRCSITQEGMDFNMKMVGKYKIDQLLGTGSFGKVFQCTDTETHRLYAIKVISLELIRANKLELQLKKEFTILKRLEHPHIIRLIETLRTKKYVFLVTELVLGGDLFDYLQTNGPFDERTARRVFGEIIDAMEYCHEKKIVHRDLKDSNVLLTPEVKVKIADFGFSNVCVNDSDLLSTLCGTPSFISPEILLHKPYSYPVDIFSAGVILFLMVSGYLPFDDNDDVLLMKKTIDCVFEMPYQFSNNLKDLISKLLVKSPEQRISINLIKSHPWMLQTAFIGKQFTSTEDIQHRMQSMKTMITHRH